MLTILSRRAAYVFFLLVLIGTPAILAGCGKNNPPTPVPSATLAPLVDKPTIPVATAPVSSGQVMAQATRPARVSTPEQPVTAVGNKQEPESTGGTVVLWHSWAQTDGDALTQILTAFHQKYPAIKVDTLFVANTDLLQSYVEAVRGNGGPDLILAPNWWLSALAAAGVVAPLDDLVPAEQLNDYWPATVDNLRWQGSLYGLPVDYNLVTLYYNRGLLSANRLPKTTDDLLSLAKQDPHLGSGLYANLFHLYWGIPAYGGRLLDKNGRAILDQNNGAAKFLTWLAAFNQIPGSYVNQDYGMLIDRFKKGEFTFFVDGPWSRAELLGAIGDNLGVAKLPAGPAGPAQPWLYTDGLFLNPKRPSAQRSLALLLARYVTGAAAGAQLAQVASELPANRTAQVGDNPLLKGFVAQAADAKSMPTGSVMDQVWGYGGDMIIKALAGDEQPSKIISETTALINDANGK